MLKTDQNMGSMTINVSSWRVLTGGVVDEGGTAAHQNLRAGREEEAHDHGAEE